MVTQEESGTERHRGHPETPGSYFLLRGPIFYYEVGPQTAGWPSAARPGSQQPVLPGLA